MITIKLPIRKTENKELIENKQYNYSGAFRNLYKRIEESTDPNFIQEIKHRFALNDIKYRSLKADESKSNYIKKNGRMYSCCCRIEEEVYKVCHERVEKVFSGMELNANGSYYPYGSNLVRWVDFVKC